MNIDNKAFVIVARSMAIIAVIGLCTAPPCLAANEVSKIRSITSSDAAGGPVSVRANDYFDIIGTLNSIETGQVVIGGTKLKLSGGASTSGIQLYDEVGAHLNARGEVTAIEVITDEPH